MPYPFTNVLHPVGVDNMGGLSIDVYFAPAISIKGTPVFKSEDSVVLEGTYVLEGDAKFVHISASYKSSSLKSSPVGDVDSRCSKLEGDFFHPGASETAAKFARLVQNTPGVFIVRDNEGRYRVVGDPVNPATVTVEHNTGKSPEDRKGFTIKFEAYSTRPVTYLKVDDPSSLPFPVME